jgi:hypothetical protein
MTGELIELQVSAVRYACGQMTALHLRVCTTWGAWPIAGYTAHLRDSAFDAPPETREAR